MPQPVSARTGAGRSGQCNDEEPRQPRQRPDPEGHTGRDSAVHQGLGSVGNRVRRRVDDVVEGPDRELDGKHGHAQEHGPATGGAAKRASASMTAALSADGKGWTSRTRPESTPTTPD